MYPTLTDNLQRWLWIEAEQRAPMEAVGLMVGRFPPKQRFEIVFRYHSTLANVAEQAHVAFELDLQAQQLIGTIREQQEEIPALWHSHVQASPTPSPEDVALMDRLQIPMLIVSVAHRKMVMYSKAASGKVVAWGVWGKG